MWADRSSSGRKVVRDRPADIANTIVVRMMEAAVMAVMEAAVIAGVVRSCSSWASTQGYRRYACCLRDAN